MKSKIAGLLFLSLTTMVFAANSNTLTVIPLPHQMTVSDGVFRIDAKTRIYSDSDSQVTVPFLTRQLRPATGYPLKASTKQFTSKPIANAILLTTKGANTNLGAEGYELTVSSNSVVIRATTQAGLFYGAQTLFQLLPPQIYSTNLAPNVAWQVPCVHIEDWPRFKWRGFMLDVCRHFFTKQEVETFIDGMAMHKLNVFHWHLTDDHGWRIEIKKYPKLTTVGAWRAQAGFDFDPKITTAYGPDGRYGGFYTQDDIREVVKYAAARHITIMPEIEMPGHATAALSAYPEFSCTGGPFQPSSTAGIFDGILNPAKEGTFVFLADVISEVVELFPGQYIHVGGDEVPKEPWKNNAECQALIKREGLKNEEELQGWFVRRIEKVVSSHGRTLIGWSEILQGGLAKNAAVMDWIGGSKEAATSGHDVVMSPTSHCYFDFCQSTNHAGEPKAAGWGSPLTLNKVYAFEPMSPTVPTELQFHILGTQGNLWTEQISNFAHVQYMTFPRACALAEVTWSAKGSRDWDDFMRRLPVHMQRLDELKINYRHAAVETPEPNLLK